MKLSIASHIPETLDDIFNDPDELGLLKNVKPAKRPARESSDPVVLNFLEILDFYDKHGREPAVGGDPIESSLARRLETYRIRMDLADKVKSFDDAGLLKTTASSKHETAADQDVHRPEQVADSLGVANSESQADKAVTSLEDIFNDEDDLGLLDGINTEIFNLKNVKSNYQNNNYAMPDEIARRRPCQDFFRYERIFQQALNLIKSKKVSLRTPKKSMIKPGELFILKGQICYIDCILEGHHGAGKGKYNINGDIVNRRLHVVFDNATELDILTLSLAKGLYMDKHAKYIDSNPSLLADSRVKLSKGDSPTGYIYILETESTAPELAELKARRNLVKIGYSTKTVDERIESACKEETYLCAPVKKVVEIACFNLNPQKFENLIHAFLNKQRLNIKLINTITGIAYEPKEWFTVSAQTALEVCKHIIDGDIQYYRMNNTTGQIIKK